ncbi:hypothetical protein, partial [Leptospira santarosai]|uniref:hypothetical protein n=1 Tax=Leptospira santarosai TaxID=28183 RepID=UPI0024AFBE54
DNQTNNNDSELQAQQEEKDREALAEQEREKRRGEYLKTIKLFESLNQFKVEDGDNDVMKAKKEKLRQKEIISLNAKLKGLPISFSSLRSKSVTEETELSDYGKKAIKNYIRKLMTDPQTKEMYAGMDKDNPFIKLAVMGYLMMGCGKKCDKKTGNLLAEFKFNAWDKEEDNYELEIIKILTSEDEALKIKSNYHYAVSGKIDRFEIKDRLVASADILTIFIK